MQQLVVVAAALEVKRVWETASHPRISPRLVHCLGGTQTQHQDSLQQLVAAAAALELRWLWETISHPCSARDRQAGRQAAGGGCGAHSVQQLVVVAWTCSSSWWQQQLLWR